MSKLKKGMIVIFFLVTVSSIFAITPTHVVSNSEDWKDVFSSIHYGNLKGIPSSFLVSTNHGTVLLNGMSKDSEILVISSKKNPYVFSYPDMIKAKGFKDSDEISSDNVNIELVRDLDVKNFIIVGDSYGFNAVAVVPYAIETKSWIFFANRFNIYQIESMIDEKNPENVLVYGYVDREVRDVLTKYNPVVINNDDKFKDNIEIVKKYINLKPDTKQAILTNGEFIEREIMAGTEPVLFTGKDNVPDQIRDYLKDSPIEIGVLIGNDLVGAATNIRRSAGISVMVKFARGARSQTSGVAAVEGLDLFPLPTPTPKLSVYSIKYNRANSQLEVTYKSDSNVPIFLKGTLTLLFNGERLRLGDLEPVFISPMDYKTILYSVDVPVSDNLTAEFSVLFGETKSSLDRILQGSASVEVINVIDRCKLEKEDIKSVKYNKQKKSFYINLRNKESIDCYYDAELNNIIIGYGQRTLSPEGSKRIPAGKTRAIEINEELTESDLEKNQMVELTIYSGEREDSLVHTINGKFALVLESLTVLAIVSIVLLIMIIILIIIIIYLRKKDED